MEFILGIAVNLPATGAAAATSPNAQVEVVVAEDAISSQGFAWVCSRGRERCLAIGLSYRWLNTDKTNFFLFDHTRIQPN